jgi:collagen beta-1,O-galactosyltransferase
MIPAVIINLAKNKERKKTMEEKIQKTCLSNYIYMDAIYGKNELHKYDFEVIPNYIDPYKNTPIYVGIIGCTLSHYCVWNYIVENNIEKLLILEDDCIFLENFDNMLKYILNLDIYYDMFYLNRHKLNHLYNLGNEIEVNDNIVIPKYCYNASSYILTYNGAKKLLNANLMKHFLPIDEFLPIMYDYEYPHKKYSCYFEKYPKLKTFAIKHDITDQENRIVFPSDVENSNMYSGSHNK